MCVNTSAHKYQSRSVCKMCMHAWSFVKANECTEASVCAHRDTHTDTHADINVYSCHKAFAYIGASVCEYNIGICVYTSICMCV